MSEPSTPQGRKGRRLPSAPGARKLPGTPGTPSSGAGAAASSSTSLSTSSLVPQSSAQAAQDEDYGEDPVALALPINEDMGSQNVTVSVRVRPFNEREKASGLSSVIHMEGGKTTLSEAATGRSYAFHFDNSFWSHITSDAHFVSQEGIYRKLGKPLLKRSLEGYNCCLFAYGQTGSGKSFSMMGVPGQRLGEAEHDLLSEGIIPRFCNDLFASMSQITAATPTATFKVEISYFEIYSERIYDLLVPTSAKRDKLRVREHPVFGPYVDNLSTYAATTYADIESWLNVGGKHRATASTNMNATSSRSHAVFSLVVTQTTGQGEEEHSKVSKVNLIDLAGSERSDVAGTSGVRLREGSAINKSLHTLGKVISSLAEMSSKKRKVFIPYRDSVLTWILKDSLGGNSKTAMLATLSPAIENFEETLSTLRYAQQARKIVNDAHVNEDPNIALIRQLRQEIDYLRQMAGGGGSGADGNVTEVKSLREQLAATQSIMDMMNQNWEEKVRRAEMMREENSRQMEAQGITKDLRKIDNRLPNLVNLNEDPQLSEMLIYILKDGTTSVGSSETCDVQLGGVFVLPDHASISYNSGDKGVTIAVQPDALIYVNGEEVAPGQSRSLVHGDRIIVGTHHFFRLNIPRDSRPTGGAASAANAAKDYAFAKKELERVQTERLEAERQRVEKELELEHARETQQILDQLERQRLDAEKALEQQRLEFEARLKKIDEERLEKERQEASRQQELLDATSRIRMEEREKSKAEMERERARMEEERALIDARFAVEREKSRRLIEEETAAKNRLILDLEKEKAKIEADVQLLRDANEKRKKTRTDIQMLAGSMSLVPLADEAHKSEWLKFSVLLKEANIISESLGKNTVFRRAENDPVTNTPRIKVTNTKLNISAFWSLEKFENRLYQMRELHYNASDSMFTPEEIDNIFYDPDDNWQKEDLDAGTGGSDGTPTTDPAKARAAFSSNRRHTVYSGLDGSGDFEEMMRALKLEAKARRAAQGGSAGTPVGEAGDDHANLLSPVQTTSFEKIFNTARPSSATPSGDSSSGFLNPDGVMMRKKRSDSSVGGNDARGGGDSGATPVPSSAALAAADKVAALGAEPSVPLLCRQYIKNALNALKAPERKHTATDEVVSIISSLKNAADALQRHFEAHANDEALVPLRDQGVVRNASMSAAMSVELLGNTIRLMRDTASAGNSTEIVDLVDRLSASSVAVASNLVKMIQGIENTIESMVSSAHQDILADINAISMVAGELAIANSKGDDEEELGAGDEEGADSEEYFDEEEEEMQYTMAARMVELAPQQSDHDSRRHSMMMMGDSYMNHSGSFGGGAGPGGIDNAVLLAFERGAHLHVEKSLENCQKDLDARAKAVLALSPKIGRQSNLNEAILQETASVITSTRSTLSTAGQLQAHLTDQAQEDAEMNAKRTFYRKSYARTKGLIKQVQEVADATSWLADSCSLAASGNDDVEQVMSHSKNLRTAIAHLLSAADTRVGAGSLTKQQLTGSLRDAANAVYKSTSSLQKECQSFSGSDQGRLTRQSSLKRSGIASSVPTSPSSPKMTSAGIHTPTRGSMSSSTNAMSDVRRKMLALEQQATVLRLENELQEARKVMSSMHRQEYNPNAATSSI